MGGGLLQLEAYGIQDLVLTGNPQISYFKSVYRRHTNFSIECIEQTFNLNPSAEGSTITSILERNGDLITSMHLEVLMQGTIDSGANGSNYQNWTNNTGHALIDYAEIKIGGHKIDRQYGQWLDIWNEFTDENKKEFILLNKHSAKITYLESQTALQNLRMYIPLKFWFNKHTSLAIPIIALQYHEIEFVLKTRPTTSLINHDGNTDVIHTTAPNIQLWVDYVYLDTEERRKFSESHHEYLIEQVQFQQETTSTKTRLNFNHPVKQLIWTIQDNTANSTDLQADPTVNVNGVAATDGNDWFNYASLAGTTSEIINSATSNEAFSKMKIQLNGIDRFAARNASYFRTMHPIQIGLRVPEKHIYCYSFALKPAHYQPSGTCNFSKIDTADMIFDNIAGTDANPATIRIYALGYNVLRIMNGMGGLAYSN